MVVVVALLAACAPAPGPRAHGPEGSDPATSSTPGTPPGPSTAPTTIDTGTPPDCDAPGGPFAWASSDLVQTEEDFDFDQAGYLVTQRSTDLVGVLRDGTVALVATSIGADAAGIRSLPSGDIVVAQPDSGTLRYVTYGTGGSEVVVSGLNFPNGIEAATDGSIYSSEHVPNGEIRRVDPVSGAVEILATAEYPNNLALSPDEQTLYIVSSTGAFFGSSSILALDRDATGAWSPTVRVFRDYDKMLGGLAVDVCGNVYVVEYTGGLVVRIPPDAASAEVVAELPLGGSYSALRFSPGIGDWDRTELFATDRVKLFFLDVGIAGRHVLAGGSG